MIVDLLKGERSPAVRVGDVVYDVTHTWPLFCNILEEKVCCAHAGIVLSATPHYDGTTSLRVLGLPWAPEHGTLGEADWPTCGWSVDLIAQRMDVLEEALAAISLLWNDIVKDVPKLAAKARVKWIDDSEERPPYDPGLGPPYKRRGFGGRYFTSGTCVGFVEYCYEQVGLDLVADDDLELSTLPTALQIHAFYSGIFPLPIRLDERELFRYPNCVMKGARDQSGSPIKYPIAVR